MALATALDPAIGYDKASEVAKTALKEDETVKEVVVEKGYLSEAEVEEVPDSAAMTGRVILGDDCSAFPVQSAQRSVGAAS